MIIFDNNGILRKIENLGLQPLHFKLSNSIPNAKRHTIAKLVFVCLKLFIMFYFYFYSIILI